MKISYAVSGLALAAGLLTATLAQAATAAGSPPAAEPPKQVGNWFVRCISVASPSPCEMYSGLDDKNSHQRILMVSFAFMPSANAHVMQIAVPLGISIGKGVVIQTDSFTSPALHYRRCDNAGCYVEMPINNASVESIAKSGANAAIKIVADNGKAFNLPLSLDGFSGAHDSMVELAKQKASKPAAGDAAAPAPAPAP